MDEPWDLSEYPLWHGAMPMRYQAQFGSPSKLLVRGNGCWVEDAAGRRFFDARAGICNMGLGYGRTDLVEAMTKQARELPFACAIRYERPSFTTVEYARALVASAPDSLSRVRLTHMGTASLETAFMMTRLFFKNQGMNSKRHILSLDGSFHGTSYLTMAASGEPDLHAIYGPMPEGFSQVAAPLADDAESCLQPVREEIERLGSENIAGFVLEPVMGSRVTIPPDGYLKGLRALCDEHNLLLIFDEVVTGFGRLGAMYASDLFHVVPDIMCLAKGISAGYATMGAVLVSDRVFEVFDRPESMYFAFGSSTDGHPIAAAVGLAVLEAYRREDVVTNAQTQGASLKERLHESLHDHPLVSDVRGLGCYIGIEICEKDGAPAGLDRMREIRLACEQRSLFVHYTHNLLILMPPLIINSEEVEFVAATVTEVLNMPAVTLAYSGR